MNTSEYGPSHKKCMYCKKIMLWNENCECLKMVGREIKRKAKETWSDNVKKRRVRPAQGEEKVCQGKIF